MFDNELIDLPQGPKRVSRLLSEHTVHSINDSGSCTIELFKIIEFVGCSFS